MLAARLARIAPRLSQAVQSRALSGKVSPTLSDQLGSIKDVKVKDLPQWASKVSGDPNTKVAVEGFFANYHKEYVKSGSSMPIYHVIGIMFTFGYTMDYYCHLRHEANYKYH